MANTPSPSQPPASQPPAPQTPPAAQPPVVLEPAPLKKWMLPFPKTGTGTQSVAAQEDDPQEFTKSWGQSACDGFYPLGLNGQWHGGIHFDADTGSRFNQADGVRCIADGEVIAYRYDVIPPKSCYKNYEQVQADFATSFALVRHRLQVSETFMQGDNAGKTTPSCVFYSLYMHLRHWDVYENDQSIPRPGFWVRDLSQCKVGERASDPAPQNKDNDNAPNREGWGHDPQTCKMPEPKTGPDGNPLPPGPNAPTCENITENPAPPAGGKGINLRDASSADADVVGWAPRDTVIKLGALVQVGNDKENWYRITGIEGDVFWRNDFSREKLIKQCRVHVGKLDFPIKGPQDKGKDGVYVFPAVPNDKKVAGNLEETAAIKAGELVGHLGNYLRFNPEVINCATSDSRTLAHLEVFSPEFKKFIEDCRKLEPTAPASEKTLLKIDKGAKPVSLPGYDLKLDNGKLLMPAKDSPKEGLFIKLAYGEDKVMLRADFPNGSAGYKEAEQRYIKANDATEYYFYSALDANGANPITANLFSSSAQHTKRRVFTPDESKTVWVLRSWYEGRPERQGERKNKVIAVTNAFTQAWKEFPLKAGKNEVKGSVVAVQVIDVKKKGNPLIVHSDEGTTPHSAKDGQGDEAATWWQIKYAAIEEGTFRDTVFQGEGWVSDKDFDKVTKCSPWSWPAFETTAEDSLKPLDWFNRRVMKDYTPDSPLLSQLFKLLDADGNKELTAEEIRAGWGKPWLAQTLSRQVIEHKSEWGLPMSEWDTLDAKMSEVAGKIPFSNIRPEKVWEEEKKRIKKLLWWDKVAGSHEFPSDIKVWYMHPLGLIENFAGLKKHPIILVNGQKIALEFLDFNDGEEIPEEEFTAAASEIGCEVAVVKAIARVESGPNGAYFNFNGWDRVPAILFERHIFHQKTQGAYSTEENRNISHSSVSLRRNADYPHVDGYWRSERQYERLLRAYALDKKAALLSASWGKFQLMGFNYATVPSVTSVEDMVRKFGASEKWHFKGLIGFAKSSASLRRAIVAKDWPRIARGYNGPNYGDYDVKMEAAYNAIRNGN